MFFFTISIFKNYLLVCLFIAVSLTGSGQPTVVSAPLLNDGFLLQTGWRFSPGDSPAWAAPHFDDRRWLRIDPTRPINTLSVVQQTPVCWLRLRFRNGRGLPPLAIEVVQSVASEIYLDGERLYQFGTIDPAGQKTQALNPFDLYPFPATDSGSHVLAVRVAVQPGLRYVKGLLNWDFPVIRLRLLPAADAADWRMAHYTKFIYQDSFKAGLALMLAVVHLLVYFFYPAQRSNLLVAAVFGVGFLFNAIQASSFLWHRVDVRIWAGVAFGACALMWFWLLMVAFYDQFRQRWGLCFWAVTGWLAFCAGQFLQTHPLSFFWCCSFPWFLTFLDLARLTVRAVWRGEFDAWPLLTGVLVNMVLNNLFLTGSFTTWIPALNNPAVLDTIYQLAQFSLPLALSFRLGAEFARTNRKLGQKSAEVNTLILESDSQKRESDRLRALYETATQRFASRFSIATNDADSAQSEALFWQELTGHIERHFHKSGFGVDELAGLLHVSRRTLHRKLTAAGGLGANELIRNYRLQQAAVWLGAGRTVSDVAFAAGFDSLAYFSRCFKEVYGVSPSAYTSQIS